MTRLPPLLQPWSAWLALFPADLAAPLGDLLLRLQPVLGPLRRHATSRPVEPAGVGDIVRRGSYERLLISEWAYADSAPDEFLRRAANGELLFTGPEPAHSDEPLRSIALFDAGPTQLGEPRLAHVALFILLARRAELAGAEFRWGVLQQPGVLHAEQGKEGVLRLLGARSYAIANAATLEAWQTILNDAPHDAWLVGAPDTPCPPSVRTRVLVRRSLLADQLDVVLTQHRNDLAVTLPLPPPQAGVRLLRSPFEAISNAGVAQTGEGAHSLKRAPQFGNLGDRVAVGMVDGDVSIYHIPDSMQARPGKPRQGGKRQFADSVIASGLFRKSYCTISMREGAFHFSGFPGPYFNNARNLPVPSSDECRIVPGRRHHAPVFHLLHHAGTAVSDRVLVLDQEGRLVCWTRTGTMTPRHPSRTTFSVFAKNVIGAVPVANGLLFAVSLADRTDAYLLHASATTASHLYPIMHQANRLLFGELKTWRGGGSVYALDLDGDDWLVGDRGGAERVVVPHGAIVLGCARPAPKEPPGLVVLAPNRLSIELLVGNRRSTLADSTEPIAQASFDANYDRLAWLGQKSGALTVRAIGAAQPLLQTVPRRGPDAE